MTVCKVFAQIYNTGVVFVFVFVLIYSSSPRSMCPFKNGQDSCGVGINKYIQLAFSLGGKFLNFFMYQISP